MTFADVGANVGLYSVIAAGKVGPRGTVLAFEPQSNLATMIAENARLNALGNIVVRSHALGRTSGPGTLYQVSRTNDGAATLSVCEGERHFGEPCSIAVETLDAVLDECNVPAVDGMKIDVEGAELEVLRGFANHLQTNPPEFILVECIDQHLRRFGANVEQLLSLLRSYDYSIYCLHRGRWRSIATYADHLRLGSSPDILALQPLTRTRLRLGEILLT
jgi:FkbM family methyltransferase